MTVGAAITSRLATSSASPEPNEAATGDDLERTGEPAPRPAHDLVAVETGYPDLGNRRQRLGRRPTSGSEPGDRRPRPPVEFVADPTSDRGRRRALVIRTPGIVVRRRSSRRAPTDRPRPPTAAATTEPIAATKTRGRMDSSSRTACQARRHATTVDHPRLRPRPRRRGGDRRRRPPHRPARHHDRCRQRTARTDHVQRPCHAGVARARRRGPFRSRTAARRRAAARRVRPRCERSRRRRPAGADA